MNTEVLFERDMLYPTGNLNEPGSVHVQIFNPNKRARIPVLIESKTNHLPLTYIDSIARIMQSDIFDRIFVDIKKNVDLYIKIEAELSKEYDGKSFIKVVYNGNKVEYEGASEVE
jgi:hypothetical protein